MMKITEMKQLFFFFLNPNLSRDYQPNDNQHTEPSSPEWTMGSMVYELDIKNTQTVMVLLTIYSQELIHTPIRKESSYYCWPSGGFVIQ